MDTELIAATFKKSEGDDSCEGCGCKRPYWYYVAHPGFCMSCYTTKIKAVADVLFARPPT